MLLRKIKFLMNFQWSSWATVIFEVTEVTENVTEVTKHGFGTKYMAMYGRVWLLWPCIAVYRSILQYIVVYCSIS